MRYATRRTIKFGLLLVLVAVSTNFLYKSMVTVPIGRDEDGVSEHKTFNQRTTFDKLADEISNEEKEEQQEDLDEAYGVVSTLQPGEFRSTPEKTHIAYLKAHKTGSSTIQNIFLRFGEARNLTFILGHDRDKHLPNMISYKYTIREEDIVPPPEGKSYEILCCHVIYNRSVFEHYLPEDTVYIGSVREPIKRLESSIRFFGMFKNANLSDFAKDPYKYDKNKFTMANNRMAFEFGFPEHLCASAEYKPSINLYKQMEEYLNRLKHEFDLIIVNEYMHESLILMKHLLGWHVKDILFQKKMVSKDSEMRRFAAEDYPRLEEYLYLDYALYRLAVDELKKKIAGAGEDFHEEVQHYKTLLAQFDIFCTNGTTTEMTVEASVWDSAFTVDKMNCMKCKIGEIPYIQEIRKKMYGRLNN